MRLSSLPHNGTFELLATVAHDLVAHPLLGLSLGSGWAWRLHDRLANYVSGRSVSVIRVTGPLDEIERAARVLRENGFEAVADAHDHDANMWTAYHLARARTELKTSSVAAPRQP